MARKLITKPQCMQAPRDIWYIDSCASRHLTNNRKLFVRELKAKSLNFTTTNGQTFWAESIGTVAIPLTNGTIRLKNVAYIPECDANLISLGQLRESNITFVDNKDNMTLMQGGREITRARRDCNLFIFDLAMLNKVMHTTLSPQVMTV